MLQSIRALSLLLLASCAVGAGQADPSALYEDDQGPGEKADTLSGSLTKKHLVAHYEVVSEPYLALVEVIEAGVVKIAANSEGYVIRSFELDGVPSLVWVDASTFESAVVSRAGLDAAAIPVGEADLGTSVYETKLVEQRDRALSSLVPQEGTSSRFTVTIDMCQSSRKWSKVVFDWLVAMSSILQRPIPVGIAMTGRWAYKHPTEFQTLVDWQAAGKLDITWIDHSFDHYVSADGNGGYDFLTPEWIDMNKETLNLETMLLEQGQTPSVLFRFPGLVYNDMRLHQINELGLFAIDADAWIAKGQPVSDNAVVLIHGNGNENVGITMFLNQVYPLENAMRAGTWQMVSPLEALR